MGNRVHQGIVGGRKWTLIVGGLVLLLPVWSSCETEGNAGGADFPDISIPGPRIPTIAVDEVPTFPAGASQTFLVLKYSAAVGAWMRVADAFVAFDAPGGVRKLGKTGMMGQVQFTGINWSRGEAAVTVFKEHHPLVSYVNLDPVRAANLGGPTGVIPIYLDTPEEEVEDTVTLTGIAKGLQSPLHHYDVVMANSTIQDPESAWDGVGTASFSVQGLQNEPAVLLAYESQHSNLLTGLGYRNPIYQVLQMKFASLRNDVSGLQVDFNNPKYEVATRQAKLAMALPTRTASLIRNGSLPQCGVSQQGTTNDHGWTTYLEVKPDRSQFDVALLWAESAWADDPYWYCKVKNGSASSTLNISGTPSPRSIRPKLVDAPLWMNRVLPGETQPAAEPLGFVLFDQVQTVALVVTAQKRFPTINPGVDDTKVVWYVDVGPHARSVEIPDPPLGIPLIHVIGPNAKAQLVAGSLGQHGTEPYRGKVWQRYAKSRTLHIEP